MQSIEEFSDQEKREVLSNLQCRDSVALVYKGVDLPNGRIPPALIEGRIIEVGVETFEFEFSGGQRAILNISDVTEI